MLKAIISRIFFLFDRFSKLPLLSFSVSFIVGVVFSRYFLGNWVTWVLLLSFCGIFSKILLKNSKIFLLFVILFVGGALGTIRFNYFQNLYENSWIKQNWNVENSFEAAIMKEPTAKVSNTQYVLKRLVPAYDDSNYGYILLSIPRFPEYKYGDKLLVSGIIEEPEVFEEFSYKEYLKTQEIIGKIDDAYVKKVGESGNIVFSSIYKLKDSIKSEVRRLLPEPHSSLLLGILLGVRSGMSEEFSENLSRTGTTHIIAVSGYNITIILVFLMGFSKKLGRKFTLLLSSVFLILFLVMVGPDNSPALRATLIGILFIVANNIGRRQETMTSLIFVAALMIFQNPFTFLSISFQLSFTATIGLVVLSKKVENFINQGVQLTGSDFIPTFCAIIATLPITVGDFGSFSVLSLIVNILVLPVIPAIMFASFLLVVSIFVSRIVALALSLAVFSLLNYVIGMINCFGSLEFSAIEVPQLKALPLIVYGVILLVFLESAYKKYMMRYG